MPHRPAVNRGAHALVNKAEFCIKGHKARLAGEHNAKAAFTFCKLENVHAIVTDDYLPEDITSAAEEYGIDIIVAR